MASIDTEFEDVHNYEAPEPPPVARQPVKRLNSRTASSERMPRADTFKLMPKLPGIEFTVDEFKSAVDAAMQLSDRSSLSAVGRTLSKLEERPADHDRSSREAL